MLFGTNIHYDEPKCIGLIRPENGNPDLNFEKSALTWGEANTPKVGRRLSYELGRNPRGCECAVNLRPVRTMRKRGGRCLRNAPQIQNVQ